MSEWTQEQEDYAQRLVNRLKEKDHLFDLRVEFGKLLMKHIDDLSPKERERYKELETILMNKQEGGQG